MLSGIVHFKHDQNERKGKSLLYKCSRFSVGPIWLLKGKIPLYIKLFVLENLQFSHLFGRGWGYVVIDPGEKWPEVKDTIFCI